MKCVFFFIWHIEPAQWLHCIVAASGLPCSVKSDEQGLFIYFIGTLNIFSLLCSVCISLRINICINIFMAFWSLSKILLYELIIQFFFAVFSLWSHLQLQSSATTSGEARTCKGSGLRPNLQLQLRSKRINLHNCIDTCYAYAGTSNLQDKWHIKMYLNFCTLWLSPFMRCRQCISEYTSQRGNDNRLYA